MCSLSEPPCSLYEPPLFSIQAPYRITFGVGKSNVIFKLFLEWPVSQSYSCFPIPLYQWLAKCAFDDAQIAIISLHYLDICHCTDHNHAPKSWTNILLQLIFSAPQPNGQNLQNQTTIFSRQKLTRSAKIVSSKTQKFSARVWPSLSFFFLRWRTRALKAAKAKTVRPIQTSASTTTRWRQCNNLF